MTFYFVWIIAAFIAVGVGCGMARIIDGRENDQNE